MLLGVEASLQSQHSGSLTFRKNISVSEKKQTFCLCTIGTRGDILPFTYLASELVKKGHIVIALSNTNWRSLFEKVGASFISIAPKDATQSGRNDFLFFKNSIVPSFYKTFEEIDKLLHKLPNFTVVFRSGMAGARAAVEKYDLRSVKIMLQPCQMRSVERPPWPLTELSQSRFSSLHRKTIIPMLYHFGELRSPYRKWVNKFREDMDLPVDYLFSGQKFPEKFSIMLCPSWFAMPQKDWEGDVHCLGFPLARSNDLLDLKLEKFIGKHGKPIVFTPGTGVSDISKFFTTAEGILKRLNLPGVFLSQNIDVFTPTISNVILRQYVSLDRLLPKSLLLIHHGGIGTTAQAIKAGIPQIICPDRFDQPDNALRVAELGLGVAVFKDGFDSEEWTEIVSKVIKDEELNGRTKSAANYINNNAIEEACALIQDLTFLPQKTVS